MRSSIYNRVRRLKKHRKYRNKLARRYRALQVLKQTQQALQIQEREFGL